MNTINFPATVSARQIQRDYKSIFAKIKKSNKPVMVISNNQPQVVMISPKTYERYAQSQNRQELWETITSIQADNKNSKEKEVESDVLAAVKKVRMKTYGKTARRTR